MKRWGSTHDRLKACLPPEAFEAFVREFKGEFIRVPTRIRETRQERTERIVNLLGDRTYREVAEETGTALGSLSRIAKG